MQTDGVSEEKTLVSGASREKAGGATHENADGAVRENAESTMHENADDTACENANGTIRENADSETREKLDAPPRRVLIAGAGSYIGTSFARWAEERYPGRIETREISMHGDAWRKEDFSEYDAVLHVAGIAHADTGSVTEEQKKAYYDVNTRLAIDSAKKAKGDCVPQFILMSSMIVYGESGGYGRRRVITRETRPRPASVYGDSKWRADKGVRALRTENFHVAVVRSPMVYGSGCKGNYPMLEKMAKKLSVFPDVKNERSMIYIDNLCEFLYRLVLDGRGGVFFPQNGDLVCTADLVRWIAEDGGHRIAVTRSLNPAVLLAGWMPQRGVLGKAKGLADKAFGNMAYEPSMSRYDWADYQIVGTRESVREMDRDKGDSLNKCDEKEMPFREAAPEKMTEGKVSIVTPTYNCAAYIGETIESVISQTYHNWEMIIIDDHSSDETAQIVKGYSQKDPRILYKRLKKNSGAAAARTIAMRLASGQYIAFLDSDDIWLPEKLEKQIGFMKENGYAITCTSYEKMDEEGRPLKGKMEAREKTDYQRMLLDCPVGNSSVAYDASKLGKFRVPNIRKRNDYALWLQMLKAEEYIYGYPEVLMLHRVRSGSISSDKLSLVRYHWILYRRIEHLSALRSMFHIGVWGIIKLLRIK